MYNRSSITHRLTRSSMLFMFWSRYLQILKSYLCESLSGKIKSSLTNPLVLGYPSPVWEGGPQVSIFWSENDIVPSPFRNLFFRHGICHFRLLAPRPVCLYSSLLCIHFTLYFPFCLYFPLSSFFFNISPSLSSPVSFFLPRVTTADISPPIPKGEVGGISRVMLGGGGAAWAVFPS